MINVRVARAYKNLAVAVFQDYKKELREEIDKRNKVELCLLDMVPGCPGYVRKKSELSWHNNKIRNIERWPDTVLGQLYWDMATVEVPPLK